ncbi:MAG: ComEA family DNA-binding protein [Acidimicrobiales bacterium]|nr:ComEA family DNA-binding protein [Acidimicrobiales bacterium]
MPEPSDGFVDLARPPAPRTLRDLLPGGLAALPGGRIVGLVAAAAVAALLLLVLWPRPAAPDPELSLPRASTTLSLPPVSTTATTLGALVVDVVGEVRQPGVQRVAAGARIADVVAAAGGLTDRADRARINFAAPVVDGERVFVPAVGQQVPAVAVGAAPAGGGGSPTPGTGGAGVAGAEDGAPVNLNTADLAALDTLPGIGPATAQAIIDHRTQHGPFTSVDQLLDVRGIGDAKLADLRDRVVV